MSKAFKERLASAQEYMKIDVNALNEEIDSATVKIKELTFYKNQLNKIKNITGNFTTNTITNEHKKELFLIIDKLPQLTSMREVEVVYHALQLKSNKEISSSLNISDKTVRFHKTNIFRKCEIKDTKHLIKIFLNIDYKQDANQLPTGV